MHLKDRLPRAPVSSRRGYGQSPRTAKLVSAPRRLFAFSPALIVVLIFAASLAGGRGLPAKDGIGNFGQVGNLLYRGSEPNVVAIKSLQRLGVKLIINLCMPDEASKTEAADAQANGILYTNLPLRGVGRPAELQVAQILSLIENSSVPVFIHCKHGCDRTGTIVACYRIRHDRWTNTDALHEAEYYGLSRLERAMRKYIAEFGKPAPAPVIPDAVARARS